MKERTREGKGREGKEDNRKERMKVMEKMR